MKILLTNDDGIDSVGLLQMAKTLGKDHEVFISAPDSQKSGYSHFVNFNRPIYAHKTVVEGAIDAYAVTGAPADCVKFALIHHKFVPDIVVSGPNKGANCGSDILYSGTVAAAQEGVLLGYKAIAISCVAPTSMDQDNFNYDYTSCCVYLAANLAKFQAFDIGESVININVPSLPMSEIRGVKAAPQGIHYYSDSYRTAADEQGKSTYILYGAPHYMGAAEGDTDIKFVENGYITVTPLKLDRTYYQMLTALGELLK